MVVAAPMQSGSNDNRTLGKDSAPLILQSCNAFMCQVSMLVQDDWGPVTWSDPQTHNWGGGGAVVEDQLGTMLLTPSEMEQKEA